MRSSVRLSNLALHCQNWQQKRARKPPYCAHSHVLPCSLMQHYIAGLYQHPPPPRYRESLRLRCLGPEASAVRKGRLMSVVMVEDSSHWGRVICLKYAAMRKAITRTILFCFILCFNQPAPSCFVLFCIFKCSGNWANFGIFLFDNCWAPSHTLAFSAASRRRWRANWSFDTSRPDWGGGGKIGKFMKQKKPGGGGKGKENGKKIKTNTNPLLELLDQVLQEVSVKVLSTKKCVTVGRFHLKNT